MAIDKEKYIGKFIDEGIENIASVESLLFEVREGSSIEDDLATLLRALHTLKGSARMLEFHRIETLAHALESVFVAVKEQRIGLSDQALRLILAALDTLKAGLGIIQNTKDDDMDIRGFEKELAALAANEDFLIPQNPQPQKQETKTVEAPEPDPTAAESAAAGTDVLPPVPPKKNHKKTKDPKDQETRSTDQSSDDVSDNTSDNLSDIKADDLSDKQSDAGNTPKGETGDKPSPPVEVKGNQGTKREEAKSESIRLPLVKIDGIIKSIASLQSLEISAKTIAIETEGMNELVRRIAGTIKAESGISPTLAAQFRQLEQLMGKNASTIKNYSIDVGNLTKNAYDSVISLRMLPISTILDAYPRYVFELAVELGKKVQLHIEGTENEIDKNIIEALSDVFLHMVRNALDHGIENPEERRRKNKNETGQLFIRCSRESGNMKIVISDDGRGIDPEEIRKKLVEGGVLTAAAAAALTREELTNYIFRNGFSTSKTINNISGRGVGMDAVRTNIDQLKGSILVETVPGKGTTFTILVPLSIASLMGFPILCGNMKFIIPANFVDTILLIDREEIITVVDRPGIKFENRIIKLYYLSQLLRIQTEGSQDDKGTFFVVIIHAFDEMIALGVDRISSMRQVILKSLPQVMEGLSVFSGAVLSEDYEMVPALHMPTVIKMARRTKSIDMKKRHIEYENLRKSILVVDDSLPTREIEGEILQMEGYRVDTAADGVEALDKAKNTRYDLICTDLNMPLMDGFMLTENVRKNVELAEIPIIVISSKSSDEDQKRAAMMGANRYIIKNSFNNHNLLLAVRELIGEAHG
ncbi:MAG: hybrid sensor histidine kinase/response regulator [Spirochaetaceae bacterium]|jgi:chemotaxis protein histidine kinase CheA/CheY-like chemotaxis protein|nr:hybrid sensor histidine kinase/response regulator [Spirochaetaceae bacterium]